MFGPESLLWGEVAPRWCAVSVGIQQREVPGPGTAPLLAPNTTMSCLLGVVDMAQDGGMGE